MIKFIKNTVKCAIEQRKVQSRINILIGQKKKTDYIKLELPKKYVPMIELIAMYGIDDNIQLLNIFEKHVSGANKLFPVIDCGVNWVEGKPKKYGRYLVYDDMGWIGFRNHDGVKFEDHHRTKVLRYAVVKQPHL